MSSLISIFLSLFHSCPLHRVFLHGIRAEEALKIKELFEESKASLAREEMALSSSAPNAAVTQMLRICPPAFTEGKLDGTNYTLWKFKITAILDLYELLDVILGIDTEP